MEILDFLNDYNGVVISGLTLVLVIATIWYARVTKKMLELNEQNFIEASRPFVYAIIHGYDGGLELNIKNYGKNSAYNVAIVFNPPLDDIDKLLGEKVEGFVRGHKPMLNQKLMPPEFEVKTILSFGEEYVRNNNNPQTFSVNIDYHDFKGRPFNSTYTLNIDSLVYGDKIQYYSNGYHLNNIYKQIKKMNEKK